MVFLFFSLLSIFFKWHRFIFILISLEYLVMGLFLQYSDKITFLYFFYFLSFTVISSVLGMVMMVGSLKYFGQDKSSFFSCKLIKTISFQN